VEQHPPYRFEAEPRERPPTIGSFVTAADRARFASYPRSPTAPREK
jgi:hypothetical protein